MEKIFKENDELGGLDPYSSSKAAAEIIFNSYLNFGEQKRTGLATVRAGNVIGGGDFSKIGLYLTASGQLIQKNNIKKS